MTPFIAKSHPISFFGRPFEELLKCFGLTRGELRRRRVLECPSGPSSFVAEATRLGVDAVGVDPLFYRGPEALRQLALSDFKEMFERVRENADRFVAKTYGSIDEAEVARREALGTFLLDYSRGYCAGRYRYGCLPNLAFDDRSFDLTLCGHLLFIYSEKLDAGFHRAAIHELCRVTREEIRIHPVVDSESRRYPQLDELVEIAKELGFRGDLRPVEHEFFRGSNQTLVLKR